jgi:hypothetical protein
MVASHRGLGEGRKGGSGAEGRNGAQSDYRFAFHDITSHWKSVSMPTM